MGSATQSNTSFGRAVSPEKSTQEISSSLWARARNWGDLAGKWAPFWVLVVGCPLFYIMLGVYTWNIRELNSISKRNAVRTVISKLCNRVVCLQESKVNYVSYFFLCTFDGYFLDKCVFLEFDDTSRGVITYWNSRCSQVAMSLWENIRSLFYFRTSSPEKIFYVTNIYGPVRWDGKEKVFSEVAQLKMHTVGVDGSFAAIFSSIWKQEERRGKTLNVRAMTLFNDLISDLALIDPPMTNKSFT